VHQENWPLARPFKIARSEITVAKMMVVELDDGAHLGRGECEADEADDALIAAAMDLVESLRGEIESGELDRIALQRRLPSGPVRSALDCAFWELEAKRAGRSVAALAGLPEPEAVTSVYTISVDTPAAMAAHAAEWAHMPILKIKLKGAGDPERIAAVRAAAPTPRLIVDANQSWTLDMLRAFAPAMAAAGVEMIEQPLPVGSEAALAQYRCPLPVGADEAVLDRASFAAIGGYFDMINIKLDKAGGLTEALALREDIRAAGKAYMCGCMVGTSLAMAPALLVAQGAAYVDLDGPLLLRADRAPGLTFDGATIQPPAPRVWG
jgi:L-alanine-DL-glutamate epimerase-like enolase superfamily enzyme